MEGALDPAPVAERVAECVAEVLHHPLRTDVNVETWHWSEVKGVTF